MNPLREPWTHEELQQLIPHLERTLGEIEATQQDEVRPMPPMTRKEAHDLLVRIIDAGASRPLTQRECFMHGQLLHVYAQACLAEALGHKGRCYVIPESTVQEAIEEQRRRPG